MQVVEMLKSIIKKLWIVIIVLIVSLAVSNMAWLWFFNQFTITSTSKTDITVDGGQGPANYTEKGDIINGKGN